MKHYHFGASTQLHNTIKAMIADNTYFFKRLYGRAPSAEELPLPVITFTGSEKLHGENMAVVIDSKNNIYAQGRNNVRTLSHDQNGMAFYTKELNEVFESIASNLRVEFELDPKTTIILDGEWAGSNIQSGNSAVTGVPKALYLFDYFRTENCEGVIRYHPTDSINIDDVNIFRLKDFGEYSLEVDFKHPEKAMEDLQVLIDKVENNSPIAKFFGKENNIGEGVYLTAFIFNEKWTVKGKGTKHGGKTKIAKIVDPKLNERVLNILPTILPVWRITQGMRETKAMTRKDTGTLLKWVNKDILKEESRAIASAGLEWSDVSRCVSQMTKQVFFDTIADPNFKGIE